jgi:hypothetical protein
MRRFIIERFTAATYYGHWAARFTWRACTVEHFVSAGKFRERAGQHNGY